MLSRSLCSAQVFEAMISWIKYDKPTRLEFMPKLMEHVRLPLLSRDYLVKVRPRPAGRAQQELSKEISTSSVLDFFYKLLVIMGYNNNIKHQFSFLSTIKHDFVWVFIKHDIIGVSNA